VRIEWQRKVPMVDSGQAAEACQEAAAEAMHV
jgi:hypothetical protein